MFPEEEGMFDFENLDLTDVCGYGLYNKVHYIMMDWLVKWDDDNLLDWNHSDIYNETLKLINDEFFLKKIIQRDMWMWRAMRELLYAAHHYRHRDFIRLREPKDISYARKAVYKNCQSWIQDFQDNFRREIETDFPNRVKEYYFPWKEEVGAPQPYRPLSHNEVD